MSNSLKGDYHLGRGRNIEPIEPRPVLTAAIGTNVFPDSGCEAEQMIERLGVVAFGIGCNYEIEDPPLQPELAGIDRRRSCSGRRHRDQGRCRAALNSRTALLYFSTVFRDLTTKSSRGSVRAYSLGPVVSRSP